RMAIEESQYVLHACSILPTHVHIVIQRHARRGEQIVGHLKTRAAQALIERDLHPFADERNTQGRLPPIWTRRAWTVFLDDEEAIVRAIAYVQENPIREGLPPQKWSFVTEMRDVTAPKRSASGAAKRC